MADVKMVQTCTCRCGKSAFKVDGRPLARFVCHCTICQSVYKGPYADVTTFLSGSITLDPKRPAEFRKYRSPPALSRGTCPHCSAPVIGFLTLAPFLTLAFVPSRNFANRAALPPQLAHIFYERRTEDAHDTLPKISGYWASELKVTRMVLGGLFGNR